jgi:hypothetical protein
VFTLLYTRGAESADVRVSFREADAGQRLGSADLERLGMAALVDDLLEAARCDGAAGS